MAKYSEFSLHVLDFMTSLIKTLVGMKDMLVTICGQPIELPELIFLDQLHKVLNSSMTVGPMLRFLKGQLFTKFTNTLSLAGLIKLYEFILLTQM